MIKRRKEMALSSQDSTGKTTIPWYFKGKCKVLYTRIKLEKKSGKTAWENVRRKFSERFDTFTRWWRARWTTREMRIMIVLTMATIHVGVYSREPFSSSPAMSSFSDRAWKNNGTSFQLSNVDETAWRELKEIVSLQAFSCRCVSNRRLMKFDADAMQWEAKKSTYKSKSVLQQNVAAWDLESNSKWTISSYVQSSLILIQSSLILIPSECSLFHTNGL